VTKLDLSIDEVLSTTRAVRKRLDFDRPVEMSVIRECLELALQAPTGGNRQQWHFVVVTEPKKRNDIAALYAKAFAEYRAAEGATAARTAGLSDAGEVAQLRRVVDSAEYLAANMGRAPALLIPCQTGRPDNLFASGNTAMCAGYYGSILPAFWSFMLAARARGLGTAWTTIHLRYEKEVADILAIDMKKVTQCGLTPIAYTLGTDFQPAKRRPLDHSLHLDHW
jgi:nitroreductase